MSTMKTSLTKLFRAVWEDSGMDCAGLPAGHFYVIRPNKETPSAANFLLCTKENKQVIGWPNIAWQAIRNHPSTDKGFITFMEFLFTVCNQRVNMMIHRDSEKDLYHFYALIGPVDDVPPNYFQWMERGDHAELCHMVFNGALQFGFVLPPEDVEQLPKKYKSEE